MHKRHLLTLLHHFLLPIDPDLVTSCLHGLSSRCSSFVYSCITDCHLCTAILHQCRTQSAQLPCFFLFRTHRRLLSNHPKWTDSIYHLPFLTNRLSHRTFFGSISKWSSSQFSQPPVSRPQAFARSQHISISAFAA